MTSFDQLAQLPTNERNELETLLMEFDQTWSSTRLQTLVDQLDTENRKPFRQIAIIELIKIDLHRRWSAGQGKLLEEYCHQFPELESSGGIDVNLMLAELTARRVVDSSLTVESYSSRFPDQFEHFSELARESNESSMRTNVSTSRPSADTPQVSIDTSRPGQERDTTPKSSRSSADLPEEFGRYRILRELGSGAMGKVYLALDTQLDRQVAIKTPSFQGDKNDELIARFYREARAAAKIQHRNICPVYDVGELDGRHFISMSFVKGRSLSEFIKSDKLPSNKTTAQLIHRLANALAEAHRHNVIHRDLKPANIMIDQKREPVVMDFGLARQTDTESQMTQSGMILGTPAFMAPEQLSGKPEEVGSAADIYALGVILYELLSGKLPFQGAIAQVVYQIVHDEPTPPHEIRSEVDLELEAICTKMMAKDRAERFQSMDQVAQALKGYLKGTKRDKRHSDQETQPEDDHHVHTSTPDRLESSIPDDTAASNADVSQSAAAASQLSGMEDLNAFFDAQAATDPLATSIDAISSGQNFTELEQPQSLASLRRFTKPAMGIAGGLVGIALLAFGIIFFLSTPKGTVRVETLGEFDGLQVLIDGEAIRLKTPQDFAAREHKLALKINDEQLSLDPKTSQFVFDDDGTELRLKVTVSGIELTSNEFTIMKDREAVLKIERISNGSLLVEGPTSSNPNAKTVVDNPANDKEQQSETSSTVRTPRADQGMTEADDKLTNTSDWEPLFTGQASDLNKWIAGPGLGKGKNQRKGFWALRNGLLEPLESSGYLFTREKFDDFVLELEFKLPSGGNSGVFIRSRIDDPIQGGLEVQLLDDGSFADRDLLSSPKQRCGAIHGCIGPSTPAGLPAEQWQTLRVIAQDNLIEIVLNHQTVVEADLDDWTETGGNPDNTTNKYELPLRYMSREGSIGLQYYGKPVWFRNIRVKRLSDSGPQEKTLSLNGDELLNRARASLEDERVEDSREAFQELFDRFPTYFDIKNGLWLATIYATQGNRDAHENHCRALFDRFPNPESPPDGSKVAKSYLLMPGANSPELLKKALDLSRIAVRAAEESKPPFYNSSWFRLTLALAEYRQGDYRAAIDYVDLVSGDDKVAERRSFGRALSAMIHHQLGDETAAQQLLELAEADYRQIEKRTNDWLGAKIMVDEARTLIGNKTRTNDVPNTTSIQLIKTLGPHDSAIYGLGFTASGTQVVTAASSLRIWNLSDGKLGTKFGAHFRRVDPSPNNMLISGGTSGRVSFWDVSDPRRPTERTLMNLSRNTWDVQFIEDGKRALISNGDAKVYLVNIASGNTERTFWKGDETGYAGAISVSSDGSKMAVGYRNTAKTWDMTSGDQIRDFRGQSTFVQDIEFLPGDREIVIATAILGRPDRTPNLQKSLTAWNIETGKIERIFKGHQKGVTCVKIMPDGRRIISSGHDGTVRVWDISTAEQIAEAQAVRSDSAPVMLLSLDITADGRFAATGGEDGWLRIWELPML